MRGHHGCRPISTEDYYRYGIKPIEEKFAKREAILRLCDEWTTEEKVVNEFTRSWGALECPHKSVWLAFSENELLNESGHYLVYGSELLCGMRAPNYFASKT